jgi:hypothetical protein
VRRLALRPDAFDLNEAFLAALNSALEQYDDEGRAWATAHAAAQRTPEKDSDD